jgi:hypothetical protein
MSQVERKFQKFFANFSRWLLARRKRQAAGQCGRQKRLYFHQWLKLCGVSNTDGLLYGQPSTMAVILASMLSQGKNAGFSRHWMVSACVAGT